MNGRNQLILIINLNLWPQLMSHVSSKDTKHSLHLSNNSLVQFYFPCFVFWKWLQNFIYYVAIIILIMFLLLFNEIRIGIKFQHTVVAQYHDLECIQWITRALLMIWEVMYLTFQRLAQKLENQGKFIEGNNNVFNFTI